jgi:hypothetical protein
MARKEYGPTPSVATVGQWRPRRSCGGVYEGVTRLLLVTCLAVVGLVARAGLAAASPAALPAGLVLPRPMAMVATDGHGFRRDGEELVLDAGGTGFLETAAWWTGDRPPRGDGVILAFEFRDETDTPVQVDVYSGLRVTDPFSEAHRIGGLADGTWKEARVPLNADFIFLHRPTQSLRVRLTSTGGALRLRAPRLEPPGDDDERRYGAETRAWIERRQRRARIDPRYWRLAEPASIPEAWADRRLVPFARSWMSVVRPISAPQPGEVGRPLSIRVFRNELEPLQIGVFANAFDLRNVSVAVDPIGPPIGDPGGAPPVDVDVRVAEYAKVRGQLLEDYLVEPFPQRLWPAHPFDVDAGRSHPVWLVVETREERSPPGRYRTHVRFRADGVDEVSLPLDIEIRDSRLLTADEAGFSFGGCTTGLMPEFEIAFLRRYNHTIANLWYLGARPELARGPDGPSLDFRILDAWMAAARRQGIGRVVYFLGGDPYRFPQTMHLPRTLAHVGLGLDDEGWATLMRDHPNQLPEAVASKVVDWSRKVAQHARAAGWPELIVTPFDEPAKFTHYVSGQGMLDFVRPQFRQQAALLRQGADGIRIYASIHDIADGMTFLDDIDIFSTNVAHERDDLRQLLAGAGKEFWQYAGTSDRGLPALGRFVFGPYFSSFGSTGALVWAHNWAGRFDTLDGKHWAYAWTTPFGVLSTPYLEGLREGWDDRRLLETVKRAAAARGIDLSPFLALLFAEIRDQSGIILDSRFSDFAAAGRSAAVMDTWRQRLIDKLMEIGPAGD